jgi:hypothetical protein
LIARDALYDFTEQLIAASTPDDALFEAVAFKNFRGSVDGTPDAPARKVVRADVIDGEMTEATDASLKDQGVRFTLQFWSTPDPDEADTMAALDDAKDLAYEMARQWKDALTEDRSLGSQVCLADASYFELGEGNLGNVLRGVCYLDGEINPLGQG